MKKIISVLLAISILFCICPFNCDVEAADQDADLESIIREQIEAFAKSIDQKNADDTAAKALAKHGISGGGKKLSVGKNHALTTTLMNANLALETIVYSCCKAIEVIEQKDMQTVFADSGCNWNAKEMYYTAGFYPRKPFVFEERLHHSPVIAFEKIVNPYDQSLTWMAGSTEIHIRISRGEVNQDGITYHISVDFEDRFDFNTRHGTGFQKLISGLAGLLFREFDWIATAAFELTVPNECEHSYKTKTTKPTCSAKGYTTYTCTLCGCSYKADDTAKLSHKYDGETDGDCNLCGDVRFLRGDMNGDGVLGSSDAVYLLRYSIMPNLYPLSQAADINGDGTVNSADAVYLLRHTIMPQAYPMK